MRNLIQIHNTKRGTDNRKIRRRRTERQEGEKKTRKQRIKTEFV